MTLIRGNDADDIRRNPRSLPGKVRGGAVDATDDAEMQAAEWDDMIAVEEGRTESRIGGDGNAQDAILAGTSDLDRVHRFNKDESRREKAANEDNPDVNPNGAR